MGLGGGLRGLLCVLLVCTVAPERAPAQTTVTPSSIDILKGSPVCAQGSDARSVCITLSPLPLMVTVTLKPSGMIPGLSVQIGPPTSLFLYMMPQACFDVTFIGTRANLAGSVAVDFEDSPSGALLGTIPVDVDCAAVSCTTALGCDDGNLCTDDECTGGQCVHTNNTAPCDDANPCTDDVCTAGRCVSTNNESPCDDDGNPCTDDACAEGRCVHTNN